MFLKETQSLFLMIKSRRILPCHLPVVSPQPQTCFSNSLSEFTTWIFFKCLSVIKILSACFSLFSDTFIATFMLFLSVLNMYSYILSWFPQRGCNKFYQDPLKSFFLFLFLLPSVSLKSYYAKLRLLPSLFWSLWLQSSPSSVSPAAGVIV